MPRLFVALFLLAAASPAVGADLFSRPSELCAALSAIGLPTPGWAPSRGFEGEFTCFTNLVEFGASGPVGMPTNIAFYVNGTQRDRAKDIVIKININNPTTRGLAFERLEGAAVKLLASRGHPLPEETQAGLRAQRPASVAAPFGRAELIYEPGRIDSYKIVFSDNAYLQRKLEAKSAATDDFSRCLDAVAQAAGYGKSLLNGDGEPIQESGYKSFLINGRGRDMFFCEVHPDSRYRIRAALGGQFPFKLLREGSF